MGRRGLGAVDRRLGQLASLDIGSGLSQSGSAVEVLVDSSRNALLNSDFRVWQNGTSFTSTGSGNDDDSYTADQWILLSDGNDVVDVSEETSTIPTGSRGAIALDVETANAKFGIFQPLESRDSLPFVGETVSLSFKARVTGTSITKVNAMVVEWTGTADSITSDIVNTWGADETNPSLVASWAFSDTPGTPLAVTTAYQTFEIEGITVGSSATNVGVFIWMDSIDGSNPTIGDVLYISDVQLEKGSFSTGFAPRPWGDELRLCQRFFAKSFQYGTAPAQNAGREGSVGTKAFTGGEFSLYILFPVRMRAIPTITTYNPSATNSQARNVDDSTSTAATAVGSDTSEGSAVFQDSTADPTDAGDQMRLHYSADARL